jgi:hypothetical protein
MDDLRLQDPSATIDHPIDWSDWLQTGETITGADFAIVPDLEAPDTHAEPRAITRHHDHRHRRPT